MSWASEFIVFPQGKRLQEIIEVFKQRGFPGCCAILDGTHVHVRASECDRHNYANRKKNISINNLILVDYDGYVLYVKAGKFFFLVTITKYLRVVLLICTYYVVINCIDSTFK